MALNDTNQDLASRARQLLRDFDEPSLAPYLSLWLQTATRASRSASPTPHTTPRTAQAAGDLPVLRWLPLLPGGAAAFCADFVAALCEAAPTLMWRRSYTLEQLGPELFDNYGWSELLGLSGPAFSEQIACGLLLLGPATLYPLHRHEAEEIYLPLSGTAAWQQADAIWRDKAPGTLIHHDHHEPHAMRTHAQPLLALYLWRSDDLAQSARLDPAGS